MAEPNSGYEVEVVVPQETYPEFRQDSKLEEQIPEEDDNSQIEEERKRHLKLFRASVIGDWTTAEKILNTNPNDIRAKISKYEDTTLHISSEANRLEFVEKLINHKYFRQQDLETENLDHNTPFCLAAASGNKRLVELMLEKNPNLPKIRGNCNLLPIQLAALLGHEEMVEFLYNLVKSQFQTEFRVEDRIQLLVTLINNDLYEIAVKLFGEYPELAFERANNEETALHALAQKPLTSSDLADPSQGFFHSLSSLFSATNMIRDKRMHPKALELAEFIWKKIIKQTDFEISYQIGLPWKIIFKAAELGNVQLLAVLIDNYPELILKVDDKLHSIFHVAVLNRHERVFNIIYEIGSIKDRVVIKEDDDGNNILHLAAMLPPPNRLNVVSGAALQFQRELLWFKEVRKIVPQQIAEAKNFEGKTPRALFTEHHRDLMSSGEEWLKQTAESCMIVATLIATVVFAAAFTVPGGVKDDTGSPNFLRKISFIIFSIADPISLVTSSCSILMFLSILISRYTEEDFLWALPTKLVVGISTLFISIATMMIVFCVTLFILFNEGMQGLAVFATIIAAIPVVLFLLQQYRLLIDVIRSTYVSKSLFHHRKQRMFEGEGGEEGGEKTEKKVQ